MIYRYFQSKNWAGLWVTSSYIEENAGNNGKKLNIPYIKKYFQRIIAESNNNSKLNIFDCSYKSPKVLAESTLLNKVTNTYLNLPINTSIRTSYNLIVQSYLSPR